MFVVTSQVYGGVDWVITVSDSPSLLPRHDGNGDTGVS